jgi:hypothetical protein
MPGHTGMSSYGEVRRGIFTDGQAAKWEMQSSNDGSDLK